MIFVPKNTIVENQSYPQPPEKPILDEMDTLYEDIINNLDKDTKVPDDVLKSFKIKSELNPDIWVADGNLNPRVRTKLVKIGLDFFKSLDLPESVKLKDIIFTGSLANFNWSKYSDIDLHLVLDFSQIEADKKFVEDFFYAQKKEWNETHDIKIYNYPIEVYVQDIKDKLAATAIYSVLFDKWLLKPKKEKFALDTNLLKTKAERILNLLRNIKADYENKDYKKVIDKVTIIKDKIKQMRTSGLERGGEFSIENLLFKVLRRTPFMDYLDSFKNKSYDNMMSVAETKLNEATLQQGGVLLIYGKPLEDGTRRLYATVTKQISHHDRNKKGDETGIPNRNAKLGLDVYRVVSEDGKLKAKGVAWGSNQAMKTSLAIDGTNVGLHYNKTPLHQETLQFNNITQALNKLQGSISSLPDVRWQN